MTTQALTVNFHGTNLFVVEHDGQPYTPMKIIAEGMGLDWRSQYTKLMAGHGDNHHTPQRWGVVKIAIPTAGNMQKAICMPLRKLAGWLATINPNKVKPELRDTIIQYQNECDDVLWDYWTKDQTQHSSHQPVTQAMIFADKASLIESLQTRLLICIEKGQVVSSKVIAEDACAISPSNPVALCTFLRECVPIELVPVVLEIASQRLMSLLPRV